MSKEKKIKLSDDKDLILGIERGEEGALENIYKTHFPTIARLILKNGGDLDDAKDVFQEAMIILYDKISAGSFELHSKLKTYLYSVSRNVWLKRLSKKGIYSNIDDIEEKVAVEEDVERYKEKDQQFAMMEEALDKLGEPCQTIIKDFYIRGLNMQEICEKFGYTNADNAKNQKYKCLQRLKKLYFDNQATK